MVVDATVPWGTGEGRRWAVVAASVVVAWLVVRSMAIGIAASGGDATLARALAPDSATALLVRAAAAGTGGAAKIARRRLLDRIAVRAPLRYEPFLARALADAARSRWDDAIRAGEAARRREPRAPAVRALLLQAYLHRARYADAIGEVDAIVARDGAATEAALRLLTLLAEAPRSAPFVEAALRTGPRWRAGFLDHAGADAADRALVFRALLDGRPGREAFLRALVAAGDPERAYLAWVDFLSPAAAARVRAIYDGDFREPEAPAPFAWTLRNDGLAAAERTRDTALPGGSALAVRFFGRDATDIASEMLFVPPGRYVFSARASGSAGGRFGGTLRWQIACIPSGIVLPLAGVARLPPRPVTLAATVTLPARGCAAQRLTLRGEPGDFATVTSAQFTGLRLDPIRTGAER